PMSVAALLLALQACSRLGIGQEEMSWARAALDRNERLQVVAADNQARTFTVRMKDSGQLLVIPLDQIVAGPALALQGPAKPASAAQAQSPAQPPDQPGSSPEAPATSTPAAPSQGASGSALASSGEQPTGPGAGSSPTEPSPENRGVTERPHAESAANARAGSVLASGPGYSIKASGSKAGPSRPSPVVTPPGAPEHLHDPIICQGSRLL